MAATNRDYEEAMREKQELEWQLLLYAFCSGHISTCRGHIWGTLSVPVVLCCPRNKIRCFFCCRIEEERQRAGVPPAAGSGVSVEDGASLEDIRQKDHTITVLQTEVETLTLKISQLQTAHAEQTTDWVRQMEAESSKVHAAEVERNEMHKQCNLSLRQVEQLKDENLRLGVRC